MTTLQKEQELKDKIRDFSGLLDQISELSDKKKRLWLEIYENALLDRQNAYMMFNTLVGIVEDKSTEHAIHGKTMAAYIERMSRANDQLIKLAELVAKSDAVSDVEIDPEEMFKKLSS